MNRRTFVQTAAATAISASSSQSAVALFIGQAEPGAEPGWWIREPIRWLQTNLRETDAALNPKKFIADVANFNANVLMMSAGGISSLYPSSVEYEHVSEYLPKGQDTFGEVLRQLMQARFAW